MICTIIITISNFIQDVEPNVGMNGSYTLQTLTFSLEILSSEWLDAVIKTKISLNFCDKELQEYIFILTQLLRNLLSLMLNEVSKFHLSDNNYSKL